MNTVYQTSAQLKERARMQLQGKYGIAIAMQVLIQLAGLMGSTAIGWLIAGNTMPAYLIRLGMSYILSVFLGVFSVGIALFCLHIACGRPYGIADLVYGFQNQFDKCLLISLVTTAVSTVYQAVIQLPLNLFYSTYRPVYLLLALPVTLGAVVIFTYFSLLLSQVNYLLLDFPSYSAGEIFRSSIRIMKGHKGRLLYIELSFLPLTFLSILTCGIGLLWVYPYMNMTMTNFYLNLMNPNA